MRLKITNGNDLTVSFITGEENGFDLIAFEPSPPSTIETWNSNPLAEGKMLANSHRESVLDTMTFAAAFESQDILDNEKGTLTLLLEQATDYWMQPWSSDPVWIEAQGMCETNIRYAVVNSYRFSGDGNPFEPPANADGSLVMVIDHTVWQSAAPGSAPCIEIHNADNKSGSIWSGSVEWAASIDPDLYLATVVRGAFTKYLQESRSCTGIVISNKHGKSYITHLYYEDADLAAFTDLKALFPTYNLLPNPPDENDCFYAGSDTTVADTGPFDNLVFNLLGGAGGYTITWEYYDSVTVGWWPLNAEVDNTVDLTASGLKTLHWIPLQSAAHQWVPNAVNGVTAYWIRGKVHVTGVPVVPQQRYFDVYTCNTPFWQADSELLTGNYDAIFSQFISALDRAHPTYYGWNHFMAGVRRLDRGSRFSAYINLTDEQNDADITVALTGATTTFETHVQAAAGRIVQNTDNAGAPTDGTITVTIDNDLAQQYQGKYRCLVRVYDNGAGGAGTNFGLELSYGTTVDFTNISLPERMVANKTELDYIDFGIITLVPHGTTRAYADMHYYIRIDINAYDTGDLYLFDLILIPIDEHFIQINPQLASVSNSNFDELQVISDEYFRGNARAISVDSTGEIEGFYQVIANSRQHLRPRKDSRVWCTFGLYSTVFYEPRSYPSYTSLIHVTGVQQYRNERGTQ